MTYDIVRPSGLRKATLIAVGKGLVRREYIYSVGGVIALMALFVGWRCYRKVEVLPSMIPSITAASSSPSVTAVLKESLGRRQTPRHPIADVNGARSPFQAIRSKDIPRIEVPFPFKGPIAPFVAGLKDRARAGGVDGIHAAHAIAEALYACAAWLNFPPQEPAPYPEQICAGLTKAEVNEDIAYYAQYAADSGYIPAQVQYGNFVGPTLGSNVSPENLAAYQQRWVKYRVDAILQGSTDAMTLTAYNYSDGGGVEKDPELAFSYMRAAELSLDSIAVARSVSLSGPLRTPLTPEQVDQAERYANRIFTFCCTRKEAPNRNALPLGELNEIMRRLVHSLNWPSLPKRESRTSI